jgi:hypothetical protein
MPTRKIEEEPAQEKCRHPEHNPPNMKVFSPGTYEHTCPSCGYTTVFRVRGSTLGTVPSHTLKGRIDVGHMTYREQRKFLGRRPSRWV